jgi:hypothetical protein
VWHEAAGPFGTVLLGASLVATPLAARRFGAASLGALWAWILGVALYVAVFFNLNVIHDYYQLPLLAPIAVAIAVGLVTLGNGVGRRPSRTWAWAAGALLALLVIQALVPSRDFYQIDVPGIEAASIVSRETPPGSLVVAASVESGRADDPRLLYRAGRYGWSVAVSGLSPEVVEMFRRLGASHLIVVFQRRPWVGLVALAARYPARRFRLSAPGWEVLLFDLGKVAGS